MKVNSVKFKAVAPIKGLIGFASVIIDNWLFLNNIAVFTRLNDDRKIRLVFPEKKVKGGTIQLFHPMQSEQYYILEDAILVKVQTIWN